MRRNLLLCTAACALFSSSFTFTSTSTASGLRPQERYALEGLHHHSQKDFINTPTMKTNNHRTMSSFGIVGKNPYFNQAIQKDLMSERDRINGMFYAAGRSGSGANQSELMDKLGRMYANALANQYNRDVVISIQTATMKDLEILKNIASGAMIGEGSYFSQELRKGLDRIQTDIIGESFSKNDGAQSSVYNHAMANQYNHDIQHMMLANAVLDKYNQYQLKKMSNDLQRQSNGATNALRNALNLEADNQQRVNAAHQQWITQDNHDWHKLQNTAEILHKAAKVDNALQGQNKELSDTLRKAVLGTLNSDEITNVERKGETSPPPKDTSSLRTEHGIIPPKINRNSQSDIYPKTNTTSSTSETSPNTSAKAHVKLLSKVDNTAITNPQSNPQLTDGKALKTSSFLNEAVDRKTLTPQIENSLIMPIAMFSVGVSDANNQSILLDNMQITMFEPKNYQEKSIFLSTYGNKNTFFSRIKTEQDNVQTEQDSVQKEQVEVQAEREDIQVKQEDVQTEQESVQADIRYAALQAGAILVALEHQNISTNFGFLGTYGKLSFAPKNAESSHKKMFDKWSLTAYGNIQHDSGIYASAFLSYGIFKENMGNNFIKDTPKMNNSKVLGAAATVGQKLLTSFEGVILEPQAQLVYQHLMLGSPSDNSSSSNDSSSSDEDTSKVNISKPDQWLLRIGGRLTQNKGHALSFYGKLNLIKTFSKNFQLAAMGSLVEGGFGIHAHLSQNIELHSDLSYQHKFKKVGISGINISAGMRYHF